MHTNNTKTKDVVAHKTKKSYRLVVRVRERTHPQTKCIRTTTVNNAYQHRRFTHSPTQTSAKHGLKTVRTTTLRYAYQHRRFTHSPPQTSSKMIRTTTTRYAYQHRRFTHSPPQTSAKMLRTTTTRYAYQHRRFTHSPHKRPPKRFVLQPHVTLINIDASLTAPTNVHQNDSYYNPAVRLST